MRLSAFQALGSHELRWIASANCYVIFLIICRACVSIVIFSHCDRYDVFFQRRDLANTRMFSCEAITQASHSHTHTTEIGALPFKGEIKTDLVLLLLFFPVTSRCAGILFIPFIGRLLRFRNSLEIE